MLGAKSIYLAQRRASLLAAMTALTLMLAGPLVAQAQVGGGDGVLRLVVPWNAGGGTDAVTRAVANGLAGPLQMNVVVDNKPGANGMIGTALVAQSKPDALVLGVASVETHAVNPHVYKKVPYRPLEDFTPVGMMAEFPYVLAVRSSLDGKDLAAFLAAARANPGAMSFASWGVGSSSQIAFELLKQTARIDLLHVPYTGAAPALQAVIAGQVDAVMVPLSIAEPQWRAGKLKLLGLASSRRAAIATDLPTLTEQGLPVVGGTWLAIVGPAGMPREQVERVNKALNAALAKPELRAALDKLGVQPQGGSPAALGELLKAELGRWGEVVRTARVQVD